MPYPEKVLTEDEKVVEHLHPHWITLVPATLWFLLICAVGGAGIAFAPDKGVGRAVVIGIVVVIGVILICWLTLRPWIQWRTTHYVFTTHRVLIRRGVLHHVGHDIALQRINDVGFSQTLWDRVVKAGTLTIESAGEHGQEDLHNIPRSNEVQQMLNRLIEEDDARRNRPQFQSQPYPPQGGYPPQGYPAQGYPAQPPAAPYPSQQYPEQGNPPR